MAAAKEPRLMGRLILIAVSAAVLSWTVLLFVLHTVLILSLARVLPDIG